MATVLVVEDHPTNMTLVVSLLKSVGHTVLTATDAERGLAMARASHPRHPGLSLSVGHCMMPVLAPDVGASAERAVTTLSTQLDESIDWQPSLRLSINE
jgi:CheY-like chemotaxis protein